MRLITTVVLGCLVVAGCGGAPVATPGPSSAPSIAVVSAAPPTATASPDPWTADLDQLDRDVRAYHPSPFTINPESAWVAKLAELRRTLPTATPDEQLVQLASLVGLLDTHSGLWVSGTIHAYDILFYPFSDGWYTIRALDPSLIGTRLVSIGGVPVADVVKRFRPIVPSDNESGEMDSMQGLLSFVEFLHGAGIVTDPAKPSYVLERPDGSTTTVDLRSVPESRWEEELGIVGDLMGDAPEAVARRTEPVWTRLDKKTKTFLISYNDYTETDLAPGITAMQKALDDGSADRVVLDMRYLRGGNGSLAQPLIDALTTDPRTSAEGGLVVMTGRENVSAGTVVAAALERGTKATFVGEMTPARADNFLCDCHDIVLPYSGFVVTVPTFTFHTGDQRDSIAPDVPMTLASTDFFAGKDPVLDAVLQGDLPS